MSAIPPLNTAPAPLAQRTRQPQPPAVEPLVADVFGPALDLSALRSIVSKPAAGLPDNRPDNIFAEIKVNGRTMATIYNGGAVVTEDSADNGALQALFADDQRPKGPEAARWRTEQLSRLFGGEIVMADTAVLEDGAASGPESPAQEAATHALLILEAVNRTLRDGWEDLVQSLDALPHSLGDDAAPTAPTPDRPLPRG